LGEFEIGFFGVLFGCPRGDGEEGGQFVFTLCYLGDLIGSIELDWGNLRILLPDGIHGVVLSPKGRGSLSYGTTRRWAIT
jgi:hypothetical protein